MCGLGTGTAEQCVVAQREGPPGTVGVPGTGGYLWHCLGVPKGLFGSSDANSPSGNTRVIFLQRYHHVFVQSSGWVLAEDGRGGGGGNRESCVLVLAGSLLSELVPA